MSLGEGDAVGGGGALLTVILFEALAEFADLDADGSVGAGVVVLGLPHDVATDGVFLELAGSTVEVGVGEVGEEFPK